VPQQPPASPWTNCLLFANFAKFAVDPRKLLADTLAMNVNAEPMSLPALRRLRGYTQTQLAQAAGWSHASSISRLERGQHPPLGRAERLAEALGVTLEDLRASIDRCKADHPGDEPAAENEEAPGPE